MFSLVGGCLRDDDLRHPGRFSLNLDVPMNLFFTERIMLQYSRCPWYAAQQFDR